MPHYSITVTVIVLYPSGVLLSNKLLREALSEVAALWNGDTRTVPSLGAIVVGNTACAHSVFAGGRSVAHVQAQEGPPGAPHVMLTQFGCVAQSGAGIQSTKRR